MLVKVLGGMIPYPSDDARKILYEKAHVNLGDLESYPELREAWRKVIEFSSKYSLGNLYPGIITSGATESNIIAIYLAKLSGSRRILSFKTAHYSIEKASKLLGLRHIKLPVINGYEPDLSSLESLIEEKDLVVATLGNTFTGYLDPVEEIAKIARRANAFIHVDAAFAGPILSFLDQRPLKGLDDVIRTLALDIHKIPEAPIGVGVLLAYSEKYLKDAWFEAPYIPSGRQVGLLGTRAGAPLLAAEAIVEKLMEGDDMKRLFERLMDATKKIYEELVEKGPYESPHEPQIPLLCLCHDDLNIILKRLKDKGYRAYTCRPLFNGIRLAVMPHILDEIDEIINLLKGVATLS